MFDLDQWQEVFSSLGRSPLRTALTGIGVGWGIYMLIVMMGAGNGLQRGVGDEFSDVATNSFFVWNQRSSMPYKGFLAGRGMQMTIEDYEALRVQLPEAAALAPRNQLGGFMGGNNVSRGEKTGAFSVMGDYPQIRQIEGILIEKGRFLNPLDLAERRKVAVIGLRVQELLFEPGEDPIGQYIRINNVEFQVVGLLETKQSGERAERDAQRIYVPFTTFQRAFGLGNRVGWFAVCSQPGVPASQVEERMLALLRKRHLVAPDDERAFGHFNVEEEFQKIQGLFAGIRVLVWIVGIGSLASGIIGVSIILLVLVKERTHEIGVRRALGATPVSIVGQILLEAVVLTLIAGYIGLLAGIGTLDLINLAIGPAGVGMFRQPGIDLTLALQALAMLGISGLAAGVLPALRAMSLSTVDALRDE
jgi:putative ABC transport system permease protein